MKRKSGFYRSIPLRLKIGPFHYTIKPLPPKVAEADWGDCDNLQHEIRLDRSMTTVRLAEILTHEMMHAIVHERAIKASDEVEEAYVTGTARGLLNVFIENPEWFEWYVRLVRSCQKQRNG